MATFYGQVFGSAKTSASGGGTYASGSRTFAQSYEGSVIVEPTLPEDGDGNRELMVEVWDDERDGAWATLSSPYAKDEHTLCFEGRTVEQLKDLKGRTLSVRVVAE